MSKSVWILERWVSREEMEKDIKQIESADNASEYMLLAFRKMLELHPEGYWCGCEGKSNYSQFLRCAERHVKDRSDNITYRVVVADIPNDAQYWAGYKNPVEDNEALSTIYEIAGR